MTLQYKKKGNNNKLLLLINSKAILFNLSLWGTKVSNQVSLQDFKKTGIVGTDVSAIIGLNPYSKPIDIYNRIALGYQKEIFETKQIKAGKILEPMLIKDTLKEIKDHDIDLGSREIFTEEKARIKHPTYTYLIGSPDCYVMHFNEQGQLEYIDLIEIKTTTYKNFKVWQETDTTFKVPEHYKLQTLHYQFILNEIYKVPVNINISTQYIENCNDLLDPINNVTIFSYVDYELLKEKYFPYYIKEVLPKLNSFWHDNIVKNNSPELYDDFEEIKSDDIKIIEKMRMLDKRMKEDKKEFDSYKNMLTTAYNSSKVVDQESHALLFSNEIIERKSLDSKRLKSEQPEIYDSFLNTSSYKRFTLSKGA